MTASKEAVFALAMTTYTILLFAHIMLFVYWLGTDLGVYYASSFAVRADLRLEERLRFLKLALLLDMGPRTALIMIFPVGLHMASAMGLFRVSELWIVVAWAYFTGWLMMVWWLHLNPAHKFTPALLQLDSMLRLLYVITLLALAVYVLSDQNKDIAGWLAIKFVLLSIAVALGLTLRGVIRQWRHGFSLLKAGDSQEGSAIVAVAWKRARLQGRLLWLAVSLAALIGVIKPNF